MESYPEILYGQLLEYASDDQEVQTKISEVRRKITSNRSAKVLNKKPNAIKSCWHFLQDMSVQATECFKNSEQNVERFAFFQIENTA